MTQGKKTFWQLIKFVLVSCLVSIIQLVLVNVLFWAMKGFTAPLPKWLAAIFTETTVGEGHAHWGYVLPFFLSNLLANVYGYFQNRKTTFHSKAPTAYVAVYIAVIVLLILFSTWLQGVVANALLRSSVAFFVGLAPTVAALAAGTVQMLVLFPLEKFVLFKK